MQCLPLNNNSNCQTVSHARPLNSKKRDINVWSLVIVKQTNVIVVVCPFHALVSQRIIANQLVMSAISNERMSLAFAILDNLFLFYFKSLIKKKTEGDYLHTNLCNHKQPKNTKGMTDESNAHSNYRLKG